MLELYVWEQNHRLYLGPQATIRIAKWRSKRLGAGIYELFEQGRLAASWRVVNAFELVPHFPTPALPCPRVAALLDR